MSNTFRVRGVGRFPVDMLRFCHAWPATPEDATLIEESFDPGFTGSRKRVITLFYAPGYGGIGGARWRSFGWKVLDEESGHDL